MQTSLLVIIKITVAVVLSTCFRAPNQGTLTYYEVSQYSLAKPFKKFKLMETTLLVITVVVAIAMF